LQERKKPTTHNTPAEAGKRSNEYCERGDRQYKPSGGKKKKTQGPLPSTNRNHPNNEKGKG